MYQQISMGVIVKFLPCLRTCGTLNKALLVVRLSRQSQFLYVTKLDHQLITKNNLIISNSKESLNVS